MRTTPEGHARRAVTKGGPRKRKRARKRASVGGGEDERESTGESLGCLSASLLLLSFFPLALLPWEITDTPLAPPRSRVSLRALAPPTHRAGATRRGRCDTTGREARKEDLDAERLCMVLRSRKRGGKGGWVALGEISDGDRTGFFYFFFSESLAKPITLFPLFLFSERDPSQEKEQSPRLSVSSREESENATAAAAAAPARDLAVAAVAVFVVFNRRRRPPNTDKARRRRRRSCSSKPRDEPSRAFLPRRQFQPRHHGRL